MKKGYWIVRADVTDPDGYKAYMAADMRADRQAWRSLPGARRKLRIVRRRRPFAERGDRISKL